MSDFTDLVMSNISNAPGTSGALVLTTGAQDFRSLGAEHDGRTFTVGAHEAGVGRETFSGTYTHATRTLSRGALQSSTTGARISLTAATTVAVVVGAIDLHVYDRFVNAFGAGDMPEVSVTGAASATIGRMHVCSGTSADYTVALPPVSGNAGRYIGFRMAAGLTRLVTLDANASELIDGALTRVMWAQETALLYCDGMTWTKMAGKSRAMAAAIKRTANQTSFGNGASIKVQTNVLHFDNTGLIADTSGQRLTCRRGSSYTTSAQLVFAGVGNSAFPANALIQVHVYVAGALVAYSKAAFPVAEYPVVYSESPIVLAAGQDVEVYGRQDAGSAREIFASTTFLDSYVSILENLSW
jgi:hypothetical protein